MKFESYRLNYEFRPDTSERIDSIIHNTVRSAGALSVDTKMVFDFDCAPNTPSYLEQNLE